MTTEHSSPRSERRSHERVHVQVEVSFESASALFTGITGDISRGGVFLATWRDVPLGMEADLALTLPNGNVRVRAVVRWRREASDDAPPGVGMVFLDVDGNARQILADFCAAREPLYYDVSEGSPPVSGSSNGEGRT